MSVKFEANPKIYVEAIKHLTQQIFSLNEIQGNKYTTFFVLYYFMPFNDRRKTFFDSYQFLWQYNKRVYYFLITNKKLLGELRSHFLRIIKVLKQWVIYYIGKLDARIWISNGTAVKDNSNHVVVLPTKQWQNNVAAIHYRRTKTNLNLPPSPLPPLPLIRQINRRNRKEFSIYEYLFVSTSDLSVITSYLPSYWLPFTEYLSAILFYDLYFVLATQYTNFLVYLLFIIFKHIRRLRHKE